MAEKIVFIAGGGTGGHVYPGVAIAKALKELEPQARIIFVGTADGMETKIIPREGFQLICISSGKFNFSGRPFQKLKSLLKIPVGIFQSLRLLLRYKPSYVLGVGGYASVPMVLTASLLGFPSAVWEPNAHPGLANRVLARFVDRCFIVFEEAGRYFKNKNILKYGMPVRSEIEAVSNKERPMPSNQSLKLLAFGGSSGARTLNYCLLKALTDFSGELSQFEVVHQTGGLDYLDIKSQYEAKKATVDVKEFIYDMPVYYQWADLAFCRGGASSLAELAAFGLVPIVVPLPLADDHQQRNAESLVRAEAGVMILQKDLTPEVLKNKLLELFHNPSLRAKMAQNLKKLYRPQAAQAIAKEILT